MRRILGLVALAGLAGLLALAPALTADERDKGGNDRGGGDKGDRGTTAPRARISDQEFVLKASAAGLAEVDLGMLARTNAGSAEVRRFGERMVRDHMKANQELNRVADRKGVRPAPAADPAHQAVAKRLTALKGAAFDRAFMRQMVRDHEEAVSLFEAESKGGRDKDLRNLAGKTLPTLQDHLKMARDLAEGGGKDREDVEPKDKGRKDRDVDDLDRKDKGAKDKGAKDKDVDDLDRKDKGAKDKDLKDKDRGEKDAGDKGAKDKGASDKDKGAKDKGASDKDKGASDKDK